MRLGKAEISYVVFYLDYRDLSLLYATGCHPLWNAVVNTTSRAVFTPQEAPNFFVETIPFDPFLLLSQLRLLHTVKLHRVQSFPDVEASPFLCLPPTVRHLEYELGDWRATSRPQSPRALNWSVLLSINFEKSFPDLKTLILKTPGGGEDASPKWIRTLPRTITVLSLANVCDIYAIQRYIEGDDLIKDSTWPEWNEKTFMSSTFLTPTAAYPFPSLRVLDLVHTSKDREPLTMCRLPSNLLHYRFSKLNQSTPRDEILTDDWWPLLADNELMEASSERPRTALTPEARENGLKMTQVTSSAPVASLTNSSSSSSSSKSKKRNIKISDPGKTTSSGDPTASASESESSDSSRAVFEHLRSVHIWSANNVDMHILKKNAPSLTSLHIDGSFPGAPQFFIPKTLQHLRIPESEMSIFDLLTCIDESGAQLKTLQMLTIKVVPTKQADIQELAKKHFESLEALYVSRLSIDHMWILPENLKILTSKFITQGSSNAPVPWNETAVRELPSGLIELHSPISMFEVGLIPILPRKLQHLTIQPCTNELSPTRFLTHETHTVDGHLPSDSAASTLLLGLPPGLITLNLQSGLPIYGMHFGLYLPRTLRVIRTNRVSKSGIGVAKKSKSTLKSIGSLFGISKKGAKREKLFHQAMDFFPPGCSCSIPFFFIGGDEPELIADDELVKSSVLLSRGNIN